MEKVSVHTVDGYDIVTVLSQGGEDDLVVWLHGISVDKDEYLGFFRDGAEWLASHGLTSLRFDFRGHGESSGNSLDFSIVGQNLDMRAVLEFAQGKFPGSRIHLVGASFGSPPAIFAAARYREVVHSVTLISPVLSYERTFLFPETEWGKELFSPGQVAKLYETGRLYFDATFCVSLRLVEEMWIVDPVATLRELRQRVLVIHGNRDSMVPYDASVSSCGSLEQIRFVTLDGADHGFTQDGDEDGATAQSRTNKETIYRLIAEHIRSNG